MSKILFVALFSAFVAWGLFGLLWFLRVQKWVKNKYKYCVFLLICGPVIWLFGLVVGFFHVIDSIASDKVIVKLENWLIK